MREVIRACARGSRWNALPIGLRAAASLALPSVASARCFRVDNGGAILSYNFSQFVGALLDSFTAPPPASDRFVPPSKFRMKRSAARK